MIDNLITRLDRWLRDNRAEYYSHLQPGVTDDLLTAFEQRFSLKLPTDFRALYRWRNGQAANEFGSFQHNRMFSALEEIADTKEMLDEMIGADFKDPKWWRCGWVPFLSNGGGDHLCLDLITEDGSNPGQLIAFWHDWEERSIEYPNFTVWLTELVQSMEDGTLELS